MAKNDDLKIDLSELFGGDLTDAKKEAERQEQLRAGMADPTVTPEEKRAFDEQEAERERRYQEMLRQREEEIAQSVQAAELHLAVPVDPPVDRSEELEEGPSTAGSEAAPPAGVPVAQEDNAPTAAAEVAPAAAEAAPTAVDVPPPPPPTAPAPEAVSPPPPEVIDFNAPFVKPFAGPASKPAAAPSAPPVPAAKPAPQAAPPPAQKAAEPAAPAPELALAGPSKEELARIQLEKEYLLLYDQFRVVLLHELVELTGERKAKTMLARTVEVVRNKHPEVFRNANWDAAGTLLDDGSLDEMRLIQNKAALPPAQADQIQDLAFGALYNSRMQAVEKGLGTGLRSKIQSRYRQWLSEKRDKAAASGQDTRPYDRLMKMAV